TKLEAEQLVLRETDATVIRTNFFGWSPTGRRSILEFFVNALSQGQQVRGFTDFTTSSAYAQALARGIWDLAATQATGLFHVTSPDAMTKYEFGVAVAREFGLDAELISPSTSDIEPPRQGDISLDVMKFESTVGRPLPSMLAGIEQARSDDTTLRPLLRRSP
ncbi:MAG: sugar nucleotide-binding protein, partial [Actinomycetales bacterium]|nr:sugar nucleotide-binding protein [Actinomycetales bacterium]